MRTQRHKDLMVKLDNGTISTKELKELQEIKAKELNDLGIVIGGVNNG